MVFVHARGGGAEARAAIFFPDNPINGHWSGATAKQTFSDEPSSLTYRSVAAFRSHSQSERFSSSQRQNTGSRVARL